MYKNEIQLKLKRCGITQVEIARQTGYTRLTVLNTLQGKQSCQPVQDYIARCIGEKPENLWGANYYPIKKAAK